MSPTEHAPLVHKIREERCPALPRPATWLLLRRYERRGALTWEGGVPLVQPSPHLSYLLTADGTLGVHYWGDGVHWAFDLDQGQVVNVTVRHSGKASWN